MLTQPSYLQIVNAFEIYQKIDPAIITDMFQWSRENDRQLYKSIVATLTNARNLRPVFVEKKPVVEQIAWLHKNLKLRANDNVGEHLFQAYFMKGQQDILITFCDGMEIPHDGQGSVDGTLPEILDEEKLKTTIETLLEKFEPKLVALYLHVFNLQTTGGWDNLTAALQGDERLHIS